MLRKKEEKEGKHQSAIVSANNHYAGFGLGTANIHEDCQLIRSYME
ncbi:MAG TPA: hypothetical protein VFJ51_00845 [Nitrososphaeraceae archaeon]|nr:hypothetical protein [Nitrososphaeraceae archaeon]